MSTRITPNYLDRKNEFKWLVNVNGVKTPCKEVIVNGPCRVDYSNDEEASFGCGRILVTNAPVQIVEPMPKLEFNNYDFSIKGNEDDGSYTEFQAFKLNPDGSFQGIPVKD